MIYLVYVKDAFGDFWTVVVNKSRQLKLTDVFEFATMKTFGGSAFGVKEIMIPSLDQTQSYIHGDVMKGMKE